METRGVVIHCYFSVAKREKTLGGAKGISVITYK